MTKTKLDTYLVRWEGIYKLVAWARIPTESDQELVYLAIDLRRAEPNYDDYDNSPFAINYFLVKDESPEGAKHQVYSMLGM